MVVRNKVHKIAIANLSPRNHDLVNISRKGIDELSHAFFMFAYYLLI